MGPLLGYVEEVRTLGARRTLFRLLWEGATRFGWFERLELHRRPVPASAVQGASFEGLPFSRVVDLATVPRSGRDKCVSVARRAAQGAVRCFGAWTADFGQPIDWYLDPTSGRRWEPEVHWSRALRDGRVGDVKIAWEPGRFPHAFQLARAAVYDPTQREAFAAALEAQITSFLASAPYGRGIHWSSGQELVVRLMAWLFGAHVLGPLRADVRSAIVRHAVDVGRHLSWYVVHSKYAVHNNHLLADALGLLLCAWLAPTWPDADRWRRGAVQVLSEESERQFRADGGYLQNSHNYHRVALQYLVWAHVFMDAQGQSVPVEWRGALMRSLDFLVAHQDPVTGRLPNYGANDGAMPAVLSTCEFSDFRPTLQTVSLLVRGERLYEPGPWDEEAAWLLGDEALRAPLRQPARTTVSFIESGYHVLRGRDERSFAAFRCGSIRDRFSQIDMLHVDVWWRGENVLVDGGSYLYNGPREWNAHFVGTASHNTITVDGHDQMLHWRKFKCLYWTKASLVAFERHEGWSLVAGEHVGFERHPGRCVHRRAVLLVNDDLWIVLDRVHGHGVHDVRQHWLAGPYPFTYDGGAGRLTLETGAGEFTVSVFDRVGQPLGGDVVSGRESPPRGWLSRHYGEKVPVPSLEVARRTDVPAMLLTILAGGGAPRVEVTGEDVLVEHGPVAVRFRIDQGVPRDVVVTTSPGTTQNA